jgi:hypothetical protein
MLLESFTPRTGGERARDRRADVCGRDGKSEYNQPAGKSAFDALNGREDRRKGVVQTKQKVRDNATAPLQELADIS